MWKKYVSLCVSVVFTCLNVCAQSAWMEWEEQIGEEADLSSWEEQYENLSELAEHPFNINTVTKEELEQLPFLSDKMVENILYYVYKYGPLVSLNELWGVEGMDKQTQMFLKDFIYVGNSVEKQAFSWKNLWKYNKQEVWMRTDIPLNEKAGYADIPLGEEEKFASKRYYGDPYYLNLRYKFQFQQKVYVSLVVEKDAGEPFFNLYNRKGFDFYNASVQLNDFGKLHTLVLGNYKASFGYGLVMNMGFSMGKYTSFYALNRTGKGLSKYTSMNEANYLQGAGASWKWKNRWLLTGFVSFRNQDATVDNKCITTLKTDGYHRLKKDMEKKNTVFNTLVGSNLTYDGKYFEGGFTAVYNVFNKVLNPAERLYNRYYPRGRYFYNVGVNYKWYRGKFVFSGETAVDKQGKIATLNQLTYSPLSVLRWKTVVEYVRSEVWKREASNGWALGSSVKVAIPRLSLRTSLSGVWFHTQDYASRVYMYEQGLLYAFSMMSLYGRGERWAWTMDYNWKKRLTFQVKWGWTHYRDRSTISSGAEEIQGNNKYDLQFQIRLKW